MIFQLDLYRYYGTKSYRFNFMTMYKIGEVNPGPKYHGSLLNIFLKFSKNHLTAAEKDMELIDI